MPRKTRLWAVSVTAVAAGAMTVGLIASSNASRAEPEAAAAATIPEIQGDHHLSPYDGQEVTTTGVVTAAKYDGYWLQDPEGDGKEFTSDGIFVYTGSDGAKPDVGQAVTVTGNVDEWRPGSADGPNLDVTELTDASFDQLDEDLPMPEPITIGPDGRQAPPQNADSVTDGTDIEDPNVEFDPVRDAVDFYETLEGMRVRMTDAEVVGPTSEYGEITVLPTDSTPQQRTPRGGVRYGSYETPNTQRLTIDDEIVYEQMPPANVGDVLTGEVTGPLNYDFGTFRIYPTEVPTVQNGDLQKEVIDPAGRAELSVATFNVENLDPTDPDLTFTELSRTITTNLAAPDLIALEEVQDNTGAECAEGDCEPDGIVDADETLDKLVAAIEENGGPTYEWRQISPENGADGGEPTGNIRNAFLYRTDRGLEFVDRAGGDATTPTDVVRRDGRAQLTLSPGRIDPTNEAWNDSRKPLTGEFVWRGKPVFVIANHFNSKGGDDPLTGRWQPPTRSSEEQRHAQAEVVNDFVQQILDKQANADVVVLGDINDFEFSRTTALLEQNDALIDLPSRLRPESERYSYVYQGNSQILDHILLSTAANADLRSYDIVHVNAEFADQVSDHDPQVVRLAPSLGRR